MGGAAVLVSVLCSTDHSSERQVCCEEKRGLVSLVCSFACLQRKLPSRCLQFARASQVISQAIVACCVEMSAVPVIWGR